jgi:methylmalonyl-CoA mutase cobalamin-binding subunit
MRIRCVFELVLTLCLTVCAARYVSAQDSSATLARALTTALQAHHIDVFATPIAGTQDEFAAALFYPGVQLLVVSARYPAPAALQPQIAAGNYRDVYQALHSNPIPESKLFVQDMGADGLRTDEKQTPDIVYQKVVNTTVLNGNVRDAAYRQHLSQIDPEYSRVLRALVDALSAVPVSSAVVAVR